jgi:cation transport protein ChaC
MTDGLRLHDDHVRRVHRDIPETPFPAGASIFSEADYDEHLRAFLDDRLTGEEGVLVFCYGSLIWKPVFEPAFVARATALGWQRAFCLKMVRFRGTPEQPGLMMQIDRGGTCEGVVQAIAEDRVWTDLSALWRREMTAKPPGYHPRWIEVEMESKVRRAIAFTANPESRNYAGGLSPEAVSEVLSVACGHWGSGAAYLLETIRALDRHGIRDPYLWDLQDRVAALIEERTGMSRD